MSTSKDDTVVTLQVPTHRILKNSATHIQAT